MPLALPRFCAIIDRSLRAELSLEEIARMLTGAGVRLIQVRAKQAPSGELLEDARRLLFLLPADSFLIVNDRADVAHLASAAGVHLGQDDLPPAAARALVGPEKIIGWSTHTGAQVEEAESLPVDYLAFGPIFATATKKNTEPVVGLAGLREARKLTRKPLVAIGGITPANAAAVIEAGADSVAVIAGWLAAPDIPARLEEFRRTLGRLN
jgi:thiamine-phosphate pyrophosphorylase